jgi:hypothetical protein
MKYKKVTHDLVYAMNVLILRIYLFTLHYG